MLNEHQMTSLFYKEFLFYITLHILVVFYQSLGFFCQQCKFALLLLIVNIYSDLIFMWYIFILNLFLSVSLNAKKLLLHLLKTGYSKMVSNISSTCGTRRDNLTKTQMSTEHGSTMNNANFPWSFVTIGIPQRLAKCVHTPLEI